MKKISVVIPAYQAKETLPKVLERIPASTYQEISHILVVEDGGAHIEPSATPALLSRYPKIEVLHHASNRGYGGAQKTGFKRALELESDIIVLLHADGQYAPEIMHELYAPLQRNEAEVVLGSRMKNYRSALAGGMPVYKFVANICLTQIENVAYGMHLSEYHSGYMLYSAKALQTIPFETLTDGFHFDGEMLLMAGKRHLRIVDLPIPTHYGDEESHLKPIKYGMEVLGTVMRNFLGKYDR